MAFSGRFDLVGLVWQAMVGWSKPVITEETAQGKLTQDEKH